MILLDQDLKVISASQTTSALFGYTSEQIVGRPLAWLVDADLCGEILKRLVDLAGSHRGAFTALVRVRTAAGGWRRVEMSARRRRGDAALVVTTYRDVNQITDLETRQADARARTRLDDAIEKLSRAIEQTADSVLITDRDGVIEYVNPAFETMTGFTHEEAVGRTPSILRSGIHDNEFYETLWGTILSGGTFRSIMTNRRRDGTLYDEDQTITPIRDSGGRITNFVSTGRDITQRRRTQEALLRLNQQIECEAARIGGLLHDEAGQFLTSAHIMLADACTEVAPEVREKLLAVRSHLNQIEKRLREISHEIHPQVVQDLGLRDAVAAFVETFSQRTGIPVTFDALFNVRCSPQVETLLYRFVQEGLTNTSRHAHATRAEVRLHGSTQCVCCSVKDDGDGFDVSALADRRSGLGLGLIQARLEVVGGTLAIISEPGRGTELLATIQLLD